MALHFQNTLERIDFFPTIIGLTHCTGGDLRKIMSQGGEGENLEELLRQQAEAKRQQAEAKRQGASLERRIAAAKKKKEEEEAELQKFEVGKFYKNRADWFNVTNRRTVAPGQTLVKFQYPFVFQGKTFNIRASEQVHIENAVEYVNLETGFKLYASAVGDPPPTASAAAAAACGSSCSWGRRGNRVTMYR